MIVPIGRWALEEACRRTKQWQRCAHGLGVAVNVSARQFEEAGLVEDVARALERSGLAPALLTLEITESVLMRDPEATTERLRALKQLGVRISIDSFGTGYSSLAYLRAFPADVLKIDRSFVRDLAVSEEARALCTRSVQLSKALKIRDDRRGDRGSHTAVAAAGRRTVKLGQGFFSRPLERDAGVDFLCGLPGRRLELGGGEPGARRLGRRLSRTRRAADHGCREPAALGSQLVLTGTRVDASDARPTRAALGRLPREWSFEVTRST